MKDKKEVCEACFIVEGGEQLREVLSEYRGYMICSRCQLGWIKLEERQGKAVDFNEYKTGIETASAQALSKIKRDLWIKKRAQEGMSVKELAERYHLGVRTIQRALGMK